MALGLEWIHMAANDRCNVLASLEDQRNVLRMLALPERILDAALLIRKSKNLKERMFPEDRLDLARGALLEIELVREMPNVQAVIN